MTFIFHIIWAYNLIVCWQLLSKYLTIRSPFFSFWLVVLASFLIPSALDPYLARIDGHPFAVSFNNNIDTLIKAQLIVATSLSLFYFLNLTLPISAVPHHIFSRAPTKNKHILWAGVLLVTTGFALSEVIGKFGFTFFVDFSFTDRRESLSFLSQFLLSYNLIAAAGLAFALILAGQRLIATIVAIYYIGIFSLLGGSRQPLIALAIPFFGAYIFNSNNARSRLIFLLAASQLILSFLAALLVIRYQTSINDKISLILNPTELVELATSRSDESSLRFAFYYFIESARQLEHFGELQYLTRTLFFWIPSFLDIFNIKPEDFEYKMFFHYMRGETGTLHPTFFGSIFADSLFLFPIWVALVHFVFVIFTKILLAIESNCFQLCLWTVFSTTGIMLARGAIYGPIVISIFSIIFYLTGNIATSRMKLK